MDLATALGAKSPAGPGDTVWLLGGTYRGGFTAKVSGKEGSPILFRQAPGERATVDCRVEGKGQTLFQVDGSWLVFRDFEVTCSDPKRETQEKGSSPGDINRGGINVMGSEDKFINLVVHDTAQGFGFWSSGEGGEIAGCIIYNNGWTGPDRGHGHAIYTQNKAGTKRLVDNIMFNQFCYGIHAYGSPRAFLVGYHIEGNVGFNNGAASRPTDRHPNILVGAGSPGERITLVSNFTYHTGLGGSVMLGYGALNKDVTLRDNYFVGGMNVRWWEKVVGSGNTLVAGLAPLTLDCAKCGDPAQYEWNKNTYLPSEKAVLSLTTKEGGKALSFEDWRKATGLDKDSTGFAPATCVGLNPRNRSPCSRHVRLSKRSRRHCSRYGRLHCRRHRLPSMLLQCRAQSCRFRQRPE